MNVRRGTVDHPLDAPGFGWAVPFRRERGGSTSHPLSYIASRLPRQVGRWSYAWQKAKLALSLPARAVYRFALRINRENFPWISLFLRTFLGKARLISLG